jgi:hypothetical protein
LSGLKEDKGLLVKEFLWWGGCMVVGGREDEENNGRNLGKDRKRDST